MLSSFPEENLNTTKELSEMSQQYREILLVFSSFALTQQIAKSFKPTNVSGADTNRDCHFHVRFKPIRVPPDKQANDPAVFYPLGTCYFTTTKNYQQTDLFTSWGS